MNGLLKIHFIRMLIRLPYFDTACVGHFGAHNTQILILILHLLRLNFRLLQVSGNITLCNSK